LRRRFVAIPAVAAFATTTATAVLLAPAAAAGTVPVVTTTCPHTLTVATFGPGNAVSGNATVTSRNAADRANEGEGLFLLEAGTSRPFTLAVHLGAQTHVSQVFSFTATGTSLRACLLGTEQGGGEENIGTVWTNVSQ
jgi:ABC-type transport system substrate-binding protein